MYESAYRAGLGRIAATLAASVIAASATILSISPATAAVPQVALTGGWSKIEATVTGSAMSRCALAWALKATYQGGDTPIVWGNVTNGSAHMVTPTLKRGDYLVTVMCSKVPPQDNEAEIPKLDDGTNALGTIVRVTRGIDLPWGRQRPFPYCGPRHKVPMISQVDPPTARSHTPSNCPRPRF